MAEKNIIIETKAETPVSSAMIALRDFDLKFTNGTRFRIRKGAEVKFTAPEGITREAVIKNLKTEGVI